ncbi:MAG: hypothetical protein N2313_08565 [Meiothermus ruber]|nr:hypothetical protein [Meiothermus sp.]MCX7803059.1 hypothetical protein [Meiothermus ruber]
MRQLALLLSLAWLLGACGGGAPARIEPKVDPDTRVLNAQSRQALSSFTLTNAPACLDYTSPNRPLCQATLTFSADNPQLQELAVGQVLVSEPTGAAPYGLLQRVKSISRSGGSVIVQTEEADIGEALEQGEAEFQATFGPSDLRSARALAQSVRFAGGVQVYSAQSGVRPLATLDFSFDEVIYDKDDNKATTGDQIRASGKVFFDVQNGFSAGVSWKKVLGVPVYPNGIYLKVAYGIKHNAEVKVSSGLGHSIDKEVELASYEFSPITVWAGPVPLVFVPSLKVSVSAKGQVSAGLSFSAGESLSAQACFEYNNGFHNCSSFGHSFNAGLSVGKVTGTARGTLFGKADLLLYGVVGPYAKLGGYLEMDVKVPRNPIWKLSAGVEAYLGIHAGIDLGVTEIRLDWDQKVYEKNLGTIAQSPPQPPQVSFHSMFGSPQLLKPYTICANADDPQDGPRPVSLSSNKDGSLGTIAPGTACLNYTFTSEGSRTLTASTSNSLGLSSSATFNLNVLDPPPSVEILNPKPGQSLYAGQTVLLQGSWLDPSLTTQDCTKAVWKSSLAADILPPNACGQPTVKLANSTTPRTLTLEVSNARGKKNSASVGLTILAPPANYPPVVQINQPSGQNPMLSHTNIVLRGWVQDNEEAIVSYAWKIADITSGSPGPLQNVPNGSSNALTSPDGALLPELVIPDLTAIFPSPGCGRSYRLYLEVSDGQAGPPARPSVATQDFHLGDCIK